MNEHKHYRPEIDIDYFSDEEIVDVLFSDFPKVAEQILEYLDNINE